MHNENQMTFIPDIAFRIVPDSPLIELEQSAGCGETTSITIHRVHLRLLLEEAGMLASPQPADDLAKRIAVQLCELRDGLADEIGRSPKIDTLYVQASAACDMLPVGVYPQWLYCDEDDERVPKQSAPAESMQPVPADPPPFVLEPTP